ncbi:hypothetical protein ACJ5NV_12920 [Loktanella agnita]|uniref:hypothetical protein n=1 Tax=Loktanella agnita TaxID=287097 RepID=UPI0039889A77
MHPPFFHVDHRIGPDIHHDSDSKPVKRRGLPERLRLTPATIGWPPLALQAAITDAAQPSGAPVQLRPTLQVVPPPSRSLRDTLGRWLIRAGQRMLLQNRLG